MIPASESTASDAILEPLRDRYRSGLSGALATLSQLGDQVTTTPHAPAVLESLRREVHRLHGSAGTYGFPDASRLAGALETRLIAWTSDRNADLAERGAIVGRFIRAFREAVGAGTVADTAALPVLVLGGFAGEYEEVLKGEAGLRGFTTRGIAEDWERDALEGSGARALLIASGLVDRLPADLRIPVFAISTGAPAAPRKRARQKPQLPVIMIDAEESVGDILDVVQQVAARGDHGGAKLLVVDDDPAMLAIVRAIAEHDGFRVATLASAEQLDEALKREAPELLLMDVQLEAISGIEATRTIRAIPRYRDLPVVLYSGRTDAATRERAFRAGADDLFGKPIVPSQLRQRLHDHLERRRLRRRAEGKHPTLDVALASRAMRDATSAWSRGGCRSIAVVHPAPGFSDADWTKEVGRIVGSLGARALSLGFTDGEAVLALTQDDAADLAVRLESVRASRLPGVPNWHAGVVGSDDAGRSFERAHQAATEALDVARRAGESGVHRWTLADDAVAPDVIVVEDDTALSDMVQYALHQGGYTYRSFADGETAFGALRAMRTGSHRPIVLLDVDLPGLDGHSLHERLRVDRPGVYIVVMMSVHAGESDQIRALDAGAWDYLAKPLNLRVLMAKLPMWLARSAAEP